MIDYSTQVFGKSLDQLTYQDVVDYFVNEQLESTHIEFKSYSLAHGNFNSNLKGIKRAICGFLNSDGGIVIWGAPEGVADPVTNEKRFQGQLSPLPDYLEKDWLINKISDSISPLPVGIRLQAVQLSATENVYVFEVQNSEYKPHQFENTYFARLDGQTKPAPHYFIEALFRRISYPNIEAHIKFNEIGLQAITNEYYINLTIFLFNFSRLQNEENITYRLMTTTGRFHNRLHEAESYNFVGNEPILHFGMPCISNQVIVIPRNELPDNCEVHLMLSYAGKKSPAKTSNYTLNLNNIDLGNRQNTSPVLISEEGNKLISQRQDELGTSRESTLFHALGRNPN